MPEMRLSDNFILSEFTHSQTAIRRGIKNDPPEHVINNLRRTAELLQLVRNKLGKPVVISSGYRSPELNVAVGGSRNSDHTRGNAADFTVPGYGTPKEVALAIIRAGIPFGQLIWEGTWVHISTEEKTPVNRVLTAHFKDGKVSYTPGIA